VKQKAKRKKQTTNPILTFLLLFAVFFLLHLTQWA
jgi:hypothetical protein